MRRALLALLVVAAGITTATVAFSDDGDVTARVKGKVIGTVADGRLVLTTPNGPVLISQSDIDTPTPTSTTPPSTTTTPTDTTPTTTVPPVTTPTETTTVPTTPTDPPPSATCDKTVSTSAAAGTALNSSAAGTRVCLADGTYSKITASRNASSFVGLTAEHPGKVTVAGMSLSGQGYLISHLRIVNGSIQIQQGAARVTLVNNYYTGGGFGVDMAAASGNISDVNITGSLFEGPFGEDGIRANRYHDADGDGNGLLIEGNEFRGIVQGAGSTAAHADGMQSVWGGDHLVIRKNYSHDNRSENFFVKDQPAPVVGLTLENNLMVRNGAASAGAGQPSVLNLYGPVTDTVIRNNTIWDVNGNSPLAWQGSKWVNAKADHNVIRRLYGTATGGGLTTSDNTYCDTDVAGTWPLGQNSVKNCAPAFASPSTDDYRILGSDRGIDWSPVDQTYGTN